MEVCHKVFGLGTVKNISDSNIIVSFKKGDKKFQFPQAFNGFLTTEDPELLKQVDEAKNKLTQKVMLFTYPVAGAPDKVIALLVGMVLFVVNEANRVENQVIMQMVFIDVSCQNKLILAA